MPDFTILDYIAVIWALIWWIGYTLFADATTHRRKSISSYMAHNRHLWMHQMLTRQIRMVDTSIVGNLINGISFFSSTTILVLIGLVAMLGYTEKGIETVATLPYAAEMTEGVWECKVVLLLLIFIYAFFKFTWAFRLSNYCSILIGAAPDAGMPGDKNIAARAARLSMMSAHHFNRGIRSYFFALSALAWFYHPVALIVAASWVIIVLYRREFRSQALAILSGGR